MAAPVLLPRLGMSMKTALFAEWYEPDGATVRQGEPVCRIECDYVAVDIEADADGILRHRARPGHDFPAGEVVGLILGAGERMPSTTETVVVETPAAPERPRAAPVAPPTSEPARPAAIEASPSSHDREIYEPVLLFPRRMTEAASPAPAEAVPAVAEPAPAAPEPEVDEAERNSAWERVAGDEEDFESAWLRGPGRVSLPPDFMDAPRRILPLGREAASKPAQAQVSVAAESEAATAATPATVAAAPEPEAVTEPAQPAVATAPEPEVVTEPVQPPGTAESEPEAVTEPVQPSVTAAPEPEAGREPVEPPVALAPEPEAAKEPVQPAVTAEREPEAVNEPVAPARALPEPEPVASTETPPERRTSAAPTTAILNLRVTVHMDEALKMREQLAREWSGSGVRPTNEDVVLRAVARAVVEAGASRRHDDHVGLRVLKGPDQPAPIYAFAGGASRPFRQAVSDLAALVEEGGPGIGRAQCTVTSLEAFGIDDSLPQLGRDQPLAISMGAVRRLPVVDGDRLGQTQVLTLTLAYDARVVPEAAAARLLARVRDLVEAPYALLVA